MVWLVCCIAWKMPHWEANEHTQSNWVEYDIATRMLDCNQLDESSAILYNFLE